MSLRYLFDENVDLALLIALRQADPELTAWAVGDPGAPRRGTRDPDLLGWCEAHDFVLVTNNRRTMPAHLAEHLRNGRHVPGIFQLSTGLGIGTTVDLLLIAAHASRSGEHRDQIRYLPNL